MHVMTQALRLAALLPLALAPALSAQSVTSPKGVDLIEGSASFLHFGGDRRFQQVDNTHLGSPMVIKSLGWRRNGGSATTAPARTFDFSVDMGRADFGMLNQHLDLNYLPGTRTTVFNQKSVSFPDWSASIPGPAPFDFVVPLSSPYPYIGNAALVIDFVHQNNTVAGSVSLDREFNGPTSGSAGAVVGAGCTATGRTSAFAHTANAFNLGATPYPAHAMRLLLAGTNAPAGAAAVFAFVDSADSNLTGVLCSTLHAFPRIMLILPAQATGIVPGMSVGFGHDASLVGAPLYSQLFALDVGQSPVPAVVSNARRTTIPTSTYAKAHATCYGWYTLASATGTATQFFGGGAAIQLGR
jgi:hypothetical protein